MAAPRVNLFSVPITMDAEGEVELTASNVLSIRYDQSRRHGGFGGLSPPTHLNWNIKHYKSVVFGQF